MLQKSVPTKTDALSAVDEFLLKNKYAVRKLVGGRSKWFGLDTSTLMVEKVPLIVVPGRHTESLVRTK